MTTWTFKVRTRPKQHKRTGDEEDGCRRNVFNVCLLFSTIHFMLQWRALVWPTPPLTPFSSTSPFSSLHLLFCQTSLLPCSFVCVWFFFFFTLPLPFHFLPSPYLLFPMSPFLCSSFFPFIFLWYLLFCFLSSLVPFLPPLFFLVSLSDFIWLQLERISSRKLYFKSPVLTVVSFFVSSSSLSVVSPTAVGFKLLQLRRLN